MGNFKAVKYTLESTRQFDRWLAKLKGTTDRIKLLARLDRIENGHFGDCKKVGQDLFELRIFGSSGLRVYYTIKGMTIVLLLHGGDKSSQAKDIHKAKGILKEMEG